MADTKISALTAATAALGADELPINEAGTTKKLTVAQIGTYVDPFWNVATAAQGPGFASDTYVTKSGIVLPQARMQAGVVYRCALVFTKTGAGVATPIFNVRVGAAGTTSDASVLTYTGPAQTAVIDTMRADVLMTFRSVGSGTSAVVATWLGYGHDLAVTGFANAVRTYQGQAVSSGFNSTTAATQIGVSANGGSSAAWTLQQCVAELFNLAA